MNRFEPTNEDIKKPEAQENHEAPGSVENSEELRQQMTSEAEKQTDQFKQECADDLSRVEVRAEQDGLQVDGIDIEELRGLGFEADMAKAELVDSIKEKEVIGEGEPKNNIEQTNLEEKNVSIEESKKDISNALWSVLEGKGKVEDIYAEIDKIQQNIDSLQANSIKKIFNYFKIKKLTAERLTREEQASLLIKDVASSEQLVSELIDEIEAKEKAEKIMQYAKDHFKDSPEHIAQIDKIEKERELRSVKSSMIRNNAFIFHGIKDSKSGPVGERASNLKQETAQDMRIKIAMALEPSLSTSSFRNDGVKQRLWSDLGLLLRGGQIDAAKSEDMHTSIKGIDERDNLKITTASDIDRVISQKRKTWDGVSWYNEIVIRNPKYAGLCLSSLKINKDIAKLAEELNIPIFFHDGKGNVFETSLQSESDKFILTQGKEVSPSDITDSKFDISQEKRKDLIQEVVKDDIFHIDERMSDIQKL